MLTTHLKKFHLLIILALLADFVIPKVVNAQDPSLSQINRFHYSYSSPTIRAEYNGQKNLGPGPGSTSKSLTQPKRVMKLTITAYSSTVDQTDSTPCITANGFNVCEHNTENVVAANFLPFGTKIKIPELYGDKLFTVQDRMNSRYWYHADIWLQSREKAKQFGAKYATIEIY